MNPLWPSCAKSCCAIYAAGCRAVLARTIRFWRIAPQESLLRVLDKLDQFDSRSQFVTWATAIGIRVALGQLRRSRWKDVSLSEFVPPAALPGHDTAADDWAPDAQMQRRDLLEALNTSIHRDLTDRQRTALLAELKGMPQDAIAEQLGSSRNALYKLTHDAQEKAERAS